MVDLTRRDGDTRDSSSRAVLFDLDGCIVDSMPSIVRCWSATLRDFGLPVPEPDAIRAQIGPPAAEAARSFVPDATDTQLTELVAAYRRLSTTVTDVKPYPEMTNLINHLSARGIPLGIATSKSIEVAEPLLSRLRLRCAFQVVEGTHVDEAGADKATVVGRAIARLWPLKATVMVGDRKHDMIGAHAHGLLAIGVLWGYGSEAELIAAGSDYVMRRPADLTRLLEHVR
jgi:phosphoglycolate phosphatase